MVLCVGCTFVLPAQMGSLDSYAASKPKISKKKATLIKGKSIRLKVKNRNGKKVRWSSTKRKVATVKKGKVVAKKKGKATIVAKVGKKKLRCRVTVKNPTTRLNKTRLTLTLGQKYKLTAKSNGKSKKVRWKSSNSNVASVYKGTVTAKRSGTASAEKPLFIGIDRQAALCGNPFYRRTERGDIIAVADIIAVEVETGFAAVSFPVGDKRADLFIP